MSETLKIVHVDDEHDFLDMVSQVVGSSENEHELVSLTSFYDFSNWLESAKNEPTLFIFDLEMEEADSGLQCISLVRNSKLFDSSFVVVMSQSIRREDVQAIYRAGANLFMAKRAVYSRARSAIDEMLTLFLNGDVIQPSSSTSEDTTNSSREGVHVSDRWTVSSASRNFSQLLKEAQSSPQTLSRRGNEEAFVVSSAEMMRMRSETGTLRSLETPIRLVAQNVITLIDTQREVVRGSNVLSAEVRNERLEALNRLRGIVEEAEELPERLEDGDQTAETWIDRFKSEFEDSFVETFGAENIAKATLPTALILGCGALGALIAGPVGFGAGSVLGHLITGQMKPGTAANKVEGIFDRNDP